MSSSPGADCQSNGLLLAFETCIEDDCGSACGGPGTGSATASGSSGVASTGSGSGIGSGSACTLAFTTGAPACDSCLQGSCCAQALTCSDDATCSACMKSSGPTTACKSNPDLEALMECISADCFAVCGG
jgi:hypothetical protein